MAEGGQSATTKTAPQTGIITKNTIVSNWGYLKENLRLDEISNALIQYGLLSPDQYQELAVKNISEAKRMEEFLHILHKRTTFDSFQKALGESGRHDIVKHLEREADCSPGPGANDKNMEDKESGAILQRIEQKVDKMDDKFDNMEQWINDEFTELKLSVAQRHNYEEKIKHLSEQLQSSNGEVIGLKDDLSLMKYTLKIGKAEKERVEQDLNSKLQICSTLQHEVNFLSEQLHKEVKEAKYSDLMEKEIAKMDHKINELKTKIKKMNEEQDKNTSKIKSLNRQLINAENNRRALMREQEEMDEKVDFLEKGIEERNRKIAKLEKTVKDLKGWKC